MAAFDDDEIYPEEEAPVLAVPEGGEDWDGAADAKNAAAEAKSAGNNELAVDMFTKAMELGGASALTLANRAHCLLAARRPLAALSDCDEALKLNPDSAKALRCRGLTYRHLGKWGEANKDLAQAQAIDFDPDTETIRVLVTARAAALEAERVHKRLEEEEILREKVRKQREELRARQKEEEEEEARRREAESEYGMPGGGMPGGGMPGGGMPGGGMPGADGIQQMILQMLMSDPELAAGMQNPKIMKAFSSMMGGGGGGSPEDLNDPEVKAFMEKLQTKLGPLMGMMGGGMPGGMGGMPGGMGGMPGGMGGMPGGMGGMPAGMDDDDEDMPDLEEVDGSGGMPSVEEVD